MQDIMTLLKPFPAIVTALLVSATLVLLPTAFAIMTAVIVLGLVLLGQFQPALKMKLIHYQKQKLQLVRTAAESYRQQQLEKARQQSEYLLECAINSDLSITPGMLPEDKAKSIELLRCIVAEHYLNLSFLRMTLGQNTIDWQVELLKLIERELKKDNIPQLALTSSQSVQVMNTYLDLLIQREDERSDNQRLPNERAA